MINFYLVLFYVTLIMLSRQVRPLEGAGRPQIWGDSPVAKPWSVPGQCP